MRKSKLRFVAAFLTTALAVAGLSVVEMASTPEAQAATGPCPGSQIDYYDIFQGFSNLRVYYSSSNKGTNCARTNKSTGTNYESELGVSISSCLETSPSNHCTYGQEYVYDYGWYYQYAGPVIITSMNGRCIKAVGTNGEGGANTIPEASHCG
jgi:hypothetical protein